MNHYTSFQLTMPIDLSYVIDVSDPVFTFSEVIDHIDLRKIIPQAFSYTTGRPSYDPKKLLKVILFAFMENGYCSLREIQRLCSTDIRYIWLLDRQKAPTHVTIGNFINDIIGDNAQTLFEEINRYIFEKEGVDLEHTYIDGTKIRANANAYSWVWKKACITSRNRVFGYITTLIDEINSTTLAEYRVRFTPREEYTIEYVDELITKFTDLTGVDENSFVHGRGHHKTLLQRQYEKLTEYSAKLKTYAKHIEICGSTRNSYSKTDHSATFMRINRDYMKNDQLFPAYNMQIAVCDEYIAMVDVQQYASDMDCFVPLMEKYNAAYGHYPKYPVADAGYGCMNNYIYCEEHGMEKYMKFTMYDKTMKDKDYREDPFRSVNFKLAEKGEMICPGGRQFVYRESRPVKGNRYGRTEEIYECEDCSGCELKEKCTRSHGNRRIQVNRELTAMHEEVIANLNCIHGAYLRMNRSIQAEGTYGVLKWDRSYTRARRRGKERVLTEFLFIACGFNLYKYHNKKKRILSAA